MTCDYDHDCFGQGLKFQHSSESGHSHSHGQWSWLKSPEVPCPEVKRYCKLNMLIYLLL